MDLLPRSEAEDRVRRIQAWMRQVSADAVLVLQNTDLYYFSGTVQSGLLCLPVTGDPIYLVSKSLSRAKEESPWERIIPLSNFRDAAEVLQGEGLGRLGRVGLEMDVLPASHFFRLGELFHNSEFLDASIAIRKIRMIKSPYEAAQMRQAGKMIVRAWEQLPAWIRPGVTELEVLARLEAFLRLQGHQGIQRTRGFNYEIGYGAFSAGANACYPTSFPGATGFIGLYPAIPNCGSNRPLTPGEPLIVDISGGYGGYLADATRTFIMGDLPPDMRDAHEFILELNSEIETMLKPGIACQKLYSHAQNRAENGPYAANFMGTGDNHVRFIGHGIGLELDELPVLSAKDDSKLETGMTIAIEPKIFFPERGGVGLENTYLITETGFEKFTPYREDIIHVG